LNKPTKRRSIKVPRAPSKKKAVPVRSNFKVILILLTTFTAVFGTASLVYLYKATDELVVENLSTLGSSKVSAIYSEPFMIFQGQKSSEDALRRQLTKRQYGVSLEDPKEIGEYKFDGSVLKIFTRSFTQPNGQTRDPALIWYNFQSGSIINKLDLLKKELVLEPIPIASLGGEEVRASRYKKLTELPPFLPKAFLAIEDQRFYSHFGIDPFGIFRAMMKNIAARRFVQGGSTITQQLAKNLFFTSQKSLTRKIKEAFAAVSLERHLSKDKILELYLNEVYFGRDGSVSVHGVSEAASSFLNKKIEDITISEAATLAGMVKAPSTYALRKNLKKALERRDVVIQEMMDASFITADAAKEAKAQKIVVSTVNQHRQIAPHFMSQLESELSKAIDMEGAIASGISVFTGIDREYQQCAETAISEGVAALEKNHPSLKRKDVPLEASLVSIEPFSGLVKAWVGGRDFSKNQFNHVSQAERQIGSTIKPFVYLTALSPEFNSYKVATPISILGDEPISIKVPGGAWEPQNYDKKFRGDVTVRYALENSLNVPAVYLSQRVGIPNIVDVLKRFHVSNSIDPVPSLALGALDTTLLRITSAYSALANGGKYVHPRLFSSVISRDGQLSMSVPIEEETVADEGAVYILTNIMQGVVERGTARGIRSGGFSGTAAGKTGTTNDARDAWFIGFTPNLATGVWVGFDDNKKIGLTGGVAAVPIWTSFMKCIQPYLEDNQFLAPPSVVTRTIDTATYRVIDPACPASGNEKPEVFLKGTEPETTCSSGEELNLPPPVDDDSYSGFENTESSDQELRPSRSRSIAEEYEEQQRNRSTDHGFWDSIF
jgi:penicillin-binding protein 1B